MAMRFIASVVGTQPARRESIRRQPRSQGWRGRRVRRQFVEKDGEDGQGGRVRCLLHALEEAGGDRFEQGVVAGLYMVWCCKGEEVGERQHEGRGVQPEFGDQLRVHRVHDFLTGVRNGDDDGAARKMHAWLDLSRGDKSAVRPEYMVGCEMEAALAIRDVEHRRVPYDRCVLVEDNTRHRGFTTQYIIPCNNFWHGHALCEPFSQQPLRMIAEA
eukprot:796534-Prymnesium_polylepis.1